LIFDAELREAHLIGFEESGGPSLREINAKPEANDTEEHRCDGSDDE
jgi:hypothetical protein